MRAYQVYLAEQKQLSAPSINTFISAVQFLYAVTLEMPWGKNRFVRMKVPEKLPVVLSREEVERLFHYVGFLAHRAVLMLCYGSGLRISEAVSLKAGHIDSARMLIRVEQGKGAKDRYTVLSAHMLNLLRRYWKAQRPSIISSPGLRQAHISAGRHSGSVPGCLPHGRHRQTSHRAHLAERFGILHHLSDSVHSKGNWP